MHENEPLRISSVGNTNASSENLVNIVSHNIQCINPIDYDALNSNADADPKISFNTVLNSPNPEINQNWPKFCT